VLYPPDPSAEKKMSPEEKRKKQREDQKKLAKIWKKVDTDGSGQLDW